MTDTIQDISRYIPFGSVDSLYSPDNALTETPAISLKTTPDSIFGLQSYLYDAVIDPESYMAATGNWLSDNIVYKIVVIVCFIGYCLLVYRYRGYVHTILNLAWSRLHADKLLSERSKVFDIFMNSSMVLGFLVFGLAVVKFIDIYSGEHILTAIPQWSVLLLSIFVAAAIAIIAAYQFFMLKITGTLTLYENFTDSLLYLKKIIFSLAVIVILPLVLLLALDTGESAHILEYVFAGTVFLILIFLMVRTFMLFRSQNISILLWFLYLCAIEIFPVSFFVLIALKNI